MAAQGYIRFPSISQDQIVFVSEDDLWTVTTAGGRAERLTAGVGEASYPRFSPDGSQIAFVGREEGPREVYMMSAFGGPAERLTFHATFCRVLGWNQQGSEILYASNASQFTANFETIHSVSVNGGLPHTLPFGLANAISYSTAGGVVIGRNINVREFSHWKRYRGGRMGHLWCDPDGDGSFQRLLHLQGNIADPCWVGDRIYFLSDHEGIGNLYSCNPQGEDVQRHTEHQGFYARHLSSDSSQLVYQSGADLFLFDPAEKQSRQLDVSLPSGRSQRNRKFVSAARYLDDFTLHPQGHTTALTTRGKAFSLGNWEGPVIQHGEADGVRYRLLNWLNDGQWLVAVCDAPGHEALVVFDTQGVHENQILADVEFGRALSLQVSPINDQVALTNHRNELVLVDLEAGTGRVLDRSEFDTIKGTSWSPDGHWLAYGFPISRERVAIKLCHIETGKTYQVTEPILRDVRPSFDPEGRYLYFIGYRTFEPQYDQMHFALSFPHGGKPYAIMLRKDLHSPFIAEPKALATEKQNGSSSSEGNAQGEERKNGKEPSEELLNGMKIDLDLIMDRIVPFPVSEDHYAEVVGLKGKVLLHYRPRASTNGRYALDIYDFENYKTERYLDGVSSFELSRDTKTIIYYANSRLRVLKVGDKPKDQSERSGRETGWLSLQRIKVSVQPAKEWLQMFHEAWRLQREQFWDQEMSGLDWDAIYAMYLPLVERVSSRSELSDLFWELQGELGTSHAYESGGEYRAGPFYRQGFLGVDWLYDAEEDRYRFQQIVRGEPSDPEENSPLLGPGLNVSVGDALLAINSQQLSALRTPNELLVNQADNEIQLTIEDAISKEVRTIIVEALRSERPARYRNWVEQNRRLVHELSDNKVGYIHIPDMERDGFAEFYRAYLREYDYPALIIDVRWNNGGHISSLLLEQLATRRIAYTFPRWGQPTPYPKEAPRGPMVALANEHAGSDGDIFCHSFKLMKLGPLIGTRTWGGVVGYKPRHRLVDGTLTTQPEFSYWFKDVGWNIENYGTNPDIEVDILPQDYMHDRDPQLLRGVEEAMRLIGSRSTLRPLAAQRSRKKQSSAKKKSPSASKGVKNHLAPDASH